MKRDIYKNILESQSMGRFGIRDEILVDLATSRGAPPPASIMPLSGPKIAGKIKFIENKIYDFSRISELLTLSISNNHHANSGPVCSLLEEIISSITKVPDARRVVVVSSGTAALHIACNYHSLFKRKSGMRWVTSAFTFKSSAVGALSETIVIDSDSRGYFDLKNLKKIPKNSYDGVIFTNVFSQMADCNDLAEFCKKNKKKLVIDNATGLMDRVHTESQDNLPIEIISAHHTKPWGVGECGIIICSAEEQHVIRNLINFGADNKPRTRAVASNFKLSDLAAAAVIDRLERMPYWVPLYYQQEIRMAKIIKTNLENISPLKGLTEPKSPRSYAPFYSQSPIKKCVATETVTLNKYYKPLEHSVEYKNCVSKSTSLYNHILCVPNAPEYFSLSSDEIANDLRKLQDKTF